MTDLLRMFLNKVREGVVARGRRWVQTNRSVLKWKHLLLLFRTSCVLGLSQTMRPPKDGQKRRVSGGRVQDSRSIQPRIRKDRLLITHGCGAYIKCTGSIRRLHLCRVFIERTSINGIQRTTDYPIAKRPLQKIPHVSGSHQNTQVSYGPSLCVVSCWPPPWRRFSCE